MNSLLDPSAPDVESAALRILDSDAPGQLMPLFFEMLWRKQGRDAANKPIEHALEPGAVHIFDAVVIQRGRPIQWYFTSVKEKGVLLCKLRKNVTAESIVDHFLQKKLLSVSGICAQFIEQSSERRQGASSTFIPANQFQVWLSTLPASRSGILQRFVDPALSPGCGSNWEISCIWTPSALDADRVESSKDLADLHADAGMRCDVYRPEVSVTRRLVCTRQMAMIDGACRAIAAHVDTITGGRTRISSMELQFKVGSREGLLCLLFPKRIAFSSNDGTSIIELALPCSLPVKLPMETMNSVVLAGPASIPRHPSSVNSNHHHHGRNECFNSNVNGSNGSMSIARSNSVRRASEGGALLSFANNNSNNNNNNNNTSSGGGGNRRRSVSLGRSGRLGGSSFIADSTASELAANCCIVCKRKPTEITIGASRDRALGSSKALNNNNNISSNGGRAKALMMVPLKHVLLSLEILEEEKKNAVAKMVVVAARPGATNGSSSSSSITMQCALVAQERSLIPMHVSMLFPRLGEREYLVRRQVWGDDKVPVCGQCSSGLADSLK